MAVRSLILACTILLAACSNGVFAALSQATPSPPPKFGSAPTSATFNYTGAQQNFVVPAGVTQLQITISGAQGGDSLNPVPGPYNWGVGGKGGSLTATVSVTAGESLAIFVGGKGGQGDINGSGAGGFNGGASGAAFAIGRPGGGGGGGASDIRQGGTALTNRTVVASGGGGGGAPYQDGLGPENPCWCLGGGGMGGAGGLTVGSDGAPNVGGYPGGGAGTQTSGGASRCGVTDGALGMGGGNGGFGCTGGGGGGGFYGGGSGAGSPRGGGGGGGGSSFLTGRLKDPQPGPRAGDGQVIISW